MPDKITLRRTGYRHPHRSLVAVDRYASSRPNTAPRGASPRGNRGRGPLFSIPSFISGVLVGATIVLVTGYLPEWLAPTVKPADDLAGSAPKPEVNFVFDQLLRSPDSPLAPRPPVPAESVATSPAEPEIAPAEAAPSDAASPANSVAVTESQPLPAPAPDAAPMTSVVSASAPAAPAPATVTRENQPRPASGFLLQAASFRSESDAERMRAQLLLQDLPASTTSVILQDAIWYRVVIGPFPDQATRDAAQARLQAQNITAIPQPR